LGTLALTALGPARQAYDQWERTRAEERKLALLTQRNEQLEERLDRLEDPEYVEKLAREQLDLVRPGEISYVVVPPPEPTETQAAPKPPEPSWHQQIAEWVRSFFD